MQSVLHQIKELLHLLKKKKMPILKSLFLGSFAAFFGILLSIFISKAFYFPFTPQKIDNLAHNWELTGTYPILETQNQHKNCQIVFDKNGKGTIRGSYHFEWSFNRWTGQLALKSLNPNDQRFDGIYTFSISKEFEERVLSLQSENQVRPSKLYTR